MDFLEIIIKLRFKIASCVLVTFLLSTVYALTIEDEFESFAILIPSNKNGMNKSYLSDFSSGLGALSFLQGGSAEDNQTKTAIETIKSKDFFEALSEDENFLKLFLNDKKDELTFEQKHNLFNSKLDVSSNNSSGTYKIGFLNTSPENSYKLVSFIIKSLNDYIRDKEVKKSSDQIIFLEETLNKTQNPEIRNIISSLIGSNLQNLMISEKSNEYVFTFIDSPRIPENKSKPKRTLIVLFSVISSFIFFALVFICIDLYSNIKEKED